MATGTVAKTRRYARRAHYTPLVGVQGYRLTPDQLEHLGQQGLLNSLRVERIGEEVVQMPSVEPEHGSTVDRRMAFNAWSRALRYSELDALVSPLSKPTLAIPVRALLGGEE